MNKKTLLFRLFIRIFGGKPHYPSVFLLLLALVPVLQITYGIFQIITFICMCLVLLWIIIRIIYILVFNKSKRARIEGTDQASDQE